MEMQDISLQKDAGDNNTIASPVTSTSVSGLFGRADLSIAAGTAKVLSFSDIPRDAGEIEVSSITLSIENDNFDIEILITEDADLQQDCVYSRNAGEGGMKGLTQRRSTAIHILPKPPRLKIDIADVGRDYFLDETTTLSATVINEEDEAIIALDLRLSISPEPAPFTTCESYKSSNDPSKGQALTYKSNTHLQIDRMSPIGRQTCKIHLDAPTQPSEYILEIQANYFLEADPEIPVSKSASRNIAIRRPYEATYTYSPKMHIDPWPTYFDMDDHGLEHDQAIQDIQKPQGLIQRWSVMVRISSLIEQSIEIENAEIEITGVQEAALCTPAAIGKMTGLTVPPGEVQDRRPQNGFGRSSSNLR